MVKRIRAARGFTLIEMLVVSAILVLITSIILGNYSSFGGAISLRNLAYDIALSVRQAQTYGISVRRFGANTFSAGYGVHFRLSSPTDYILYADSIENGHYDPGETVEAFSMRQGFQMIDLCIVASGETEETCGLDKLDVIFSRPEPDARIRYNDGAALNQRARVELRSPRGDEASVLIEATGQISVSEVTAAE